MAAVYATEAIRNVVLLSHSGAGKTSLAEAMLFDAGVISRLGRVDSGTTTSDSTPEEIKRQISISLSILPLPWEGKKINLLDTPGYADFVGEIKAGVRVADGAVIVVSAGSGVEVGTEHVWGYAETAELPRLIFINRMDRENADFSRVLEDLQEKFGRRFVPVQFPMGSRADFQGVVDLINMKAYKGTAGEASEVPAALEAEVREYREKLIEAVAEVDDDMMVKYLDGKEIALEEVCSALQRGAKAGKLAPVLVGSAVQNIGIPQLLRAIGDYLPSPKERGKVVAKNASTGQDDEVAPGTDSPLVALVFKTTVDAYVGRMSYLRVYTGTLSSNSPVWNSTKGITERVGQINITWGKNQETVPQLVAGDIGYVARLANTDTGNTLSNQSRPLVLTPAEVPTPTFSVALYPKTKVDVDKVGTVLPKLLEEDPALRVHKDSDTGEMLLIGVGDTHVDVAIEKLQNRFGTGVEPRQPKVPYKETVTVSTKSEYKHKKQTGGHVQYGHVLLELEPLERESGFEFTDKVVGGAVPKNFIPAVEKGVLEARNEGVLAGYPVVDVKVTLYDGSYHPVDSSEMSFKIAGSYALRKGLAQAHCVLIEPIMSLTVVVPESFTGDVIGDLNTKRARVLGMLPHEGKQTIEAHVPLAEILRYAIDLRSITQGRGSYTAEHSHYEEVPAHIVQKIVEQRAAEKGEKG